MKSFKSILVESFAKVFLLIGVGVLIWSCVVTNPINEGTDPVPPGKTFTLSPDVEGTFPGCIGKANPSGKIPSAVIVTDNLGTMSKLMFNNNIFTFIDSTWKDSDPNNDLSVIGTCR